MNVVCLLISMEKSPVFILPGPLPLLLESGEVKLMIIFFAIFYKLFFIVSGQNGLLYERDTKRIGRK